MSKRGSQSDKILKVMKDRKWRTVPQISKLADIGCLTSASSALRNLRKPQYGSHTVVKRARKPRIGELYEYQLIPNKKYKLEV